MCLKVADLKSSDTIPVLLATRLLVITYFVESLDNTINNTIAKGKKIVKMIEEEDLVLQEYE